MNTKKQKHLVMQFEKNTCVFFEKKHVFAQKYTIRKKNFFFFFCITKRIINQTWE